MNTGLIEKFAPVLCSPRATVVRDPSLLMDASGPVKVYYAPFANHVSSPLPGLRQRDDYRGMPDMTKHPMLRK